MIGTTFFEKENESFKKLNNFFMSDYNRKISNNFLVGYDLINMIIKINNNYGNYFQFGLRNEKLIYGVISLGSSYETNNDNWNVLMLFSFGT